MITRRERIVLGAFWLRYSRDLEASMDLFMSTGSVSMLLLNA